MDLVKTFNMFNIKYDRIGFRKRASEDVYDAITKLCQLDIPDGQSLTVMSRQSDLYTIIDL